MSRSKLNGFTPTPLSERVQRKRTERHGKPQVMRKRSVKEVDGKFVVLFEWVPVPAEGVTRMVARSSTVVTPERKARRK